MWESPARTSSSPTAGRSRWSRTRQRPEVCGHAGHARRGRGRRETDPDAVGPRAVRRYHRQERDRSTDLPVRDDAVAADRLADAGLRRSGRADHGRRRGGSRRARCGGRDRRSRSGLPPRPAGQRPYGHARGRPAPGNVILHPLWRVLELVCELPVRRRPRLRRRDLLRRDRHRLGGRRSRSGVRGRVQRPLYRLYELRRCLPGEDRHSVDQHRREGSDQPQRRTRDVRLPRRRPHARRGVGRARPQEALLRQYRYRCEGGQRDRPRLELARRRRPRPRSPRAHPRDRPAARSADVPTGVARRLVRRARRHGGLESTGSASELPRQ